MTDFKDTRNLFQDADIVLGLWNPLKLEMKDCLGYKPTEDIIGLKIIKNRLSKDNIAVALRVDPKSGTFTELPKPEKSFVEKKESTKYSTY